MTFLRVLRIIKTTINENMLQAELRVVEQLEHLLTKDKPTSFIKCLRNYTLTCD